MADTLLATKLRAPPSQGHLLSRPRLLRRLDAVLEKRLALVSAPAGFGKTTLVGSWIASAGVPFGWVSLDKEDDRLDRFLAYLGAALEHVRPGTAATLGGFLGSAERPPLETLLTTLANNIAGDPSPFALVLDDYHVISNAAIHRAVAFLIEHAPEMHLVILTRQTPRLPLARLRGRGAMVELGPGDLRFTVAEAGKFLAESLGVELGGEELRRLDARVEGWAAALQLAGLSLQGQSDPGRAIEAFTGRHRHVISYLAEEVLGQQPEHVRRFLLRTCVLDRLSAELCAALMGGDERAEGREQGAGDAGAGGREQGAGDEGAGGREQRAGDAGQHGETPGTEEVEYAIRDTQYPTSAAQQMLESLEAGNLFLMPLDETRHWYRYHQLFAEMLREQVRRQPGVIGELHRRAADWLERNDMPGEALGHLLAAGLPERAADVVERAAEDLWTTGRIPVLLDWLGRLPADVLRARPFLGIYHAWALYIAGRFDQALARLAEAETGVSALPLQAERADGLGMALFVRSVMSGEQSQALVYGQRALEQLSARRRSWRGAAHLSMGLAYRELGDLRRAAAALQEALEESHAAGNLYAGLFAMSNLAQVQTIEGDLFTARDTFRTAMRIAAESNRPQAGQAYLGWACIGMAEIHYEWNQLEEARRYLAAGQGSPEQIGDAGGQTAAAILRAKLYASGGEPEQAIALLETAREKLVRWGTAQIEARLDAQLARLQLQAGDWTGVRRWIKRRGLSPDDEIAGPREVELLTLARVLIARAEPATAARLLERLIEPALAGRRVALAMEGLLLLALAQQRARDASATTSLARALELAEPGGYVRTFLDEGEPAATLLGALYREVAGASEQAPPSTSRYHESLLAAFGPGAAGTARRRQPPADPLTTRELEVLRLLATGRSNQEIAARLVIAVGTLKRHTNSIYGKLGVRSRAAAAARARELGML